MNSKTKEKLKKNSTVIGIDAGTARVGFAILTLNKIKPKLIEYGLIPINETQHNLRLKKIYEYIKKLIKKYKPQSVVTERMYYYLNRKTSFEVSQAIGVINLACTELKTSLSFVNPTQVKKIITNKGNANKSEIQEKIISTFKLKEKPIDDVTDAIAIAFAHTKINNHL
ncbi:MAG: crossover junction endodeoxyribonuclease RuvC [bacterium]